jgi:hypothetical protein
VKGIIEKALDKLDKSVPVTNMEPPKQEKASKNSIEAPVAAYDNRPRLYLDDKEFPTAAKYKAGDKVVLIVECEVTGVSQYDRIGNDKKPEKSYNADLCVHAIADITGAK